MPPLYKSSFNSGVLSPRTGGRIDLAKYESALGTCENALPQPWGGVTRRMGTEFINECSIAGKRSRLFPFRYSTDQSYIIEVGDEYMRFYMDGGLIQSNDASTVALLHMDGHAGSQSFKDSSTYNKTVTAGGNVKIADSDGVFNQCAIFDGTGDYLSMADSAHWYMADLPLTVDFRVKFSALPAANEVMTIFIQRADADNYAWFTLENNGTGYYLTLELRTAGVSAYPLDAMAGWTPVVDMVSHGPYKGLGWNA
jgi:hypothetical protein